jgi:transcriptional regulator with XRE-family HTH domain
MSYDTKKVISLQIRAARGLLGWSGQDLANASGVGLSTLRRLESGSGSVQTNVSTVVALAAALEQAGIEFTGDPNTNPGVTLHLNKN